MKPRLFVPEVVRNNAASSGAAGWLDSLPALVTQLEDEWSIRVGRSFDNGTEAFVAEAVMRDGTQAVLKLLVPHGRGQPANEITVLELVAGEGCPILYRSDASRGAMLLERLGPAMVDLGIPIRRRHELLCDAATRLWRPAPGCTLPSGAEKARWLSEFVVSLWEELDHLCSEAAVEHAVSCAGRRERAHDDERAWLVHGDVHQWNALDAGDGTFKLVDPDGLLAEREYDLGILMREDPEELLGGDPRDRSRWLAARTGLDETAIWEWGVVERVSTGLLCVQDGLEPVGSQMLEVADAIASGADR